jgi:anti-sigma factor RsiW
MTQSQNDPKRGEPQRDEPVRREPCIDAAWKVTCEHLAEFLMEYVDGRVPDEERFVFDSHIAFCKDCEVYVTNYRHTLDLTRDLAAPGTSAEPMPEALVRAILAARKREA